jgi:membrane carboxypeptidase/penicillin-binding protein
MGRFEKKIAGAKETGAHAALPIWMNFMTVAMAGKIPRLPACTDCAALDTPKVDTPDAAPATEEAH